MIHAVNHVKLNQNQLRVVHQYHRAITQNTVMVWQHSVPQMFMHQMDLPVIPLLQERHARQVCVRVETYNVKDTVV